jgi:hypothetical protein
MYLHRQSSGMMLLLLLLPVAICAIIAWTSRLWWLYLLAVVLVLVAWLFSSLTIGVTKRELASCFGPGFWRTRVPLGELAPLRAGLPQEIVR